MSIASWDHSTFTHDGVSHETYRKGNGPAVVVVPEIPGITPKVLEFAERVVAQGFTVVMPLLVGQVGREPSGGYIASSMSKICISREFTTMAMHKTSPIISWLRALALKIHSEVGGVGVGAVGMCFSGGFALGMMVDDIMVAPVLSQPSMPFAIGAHRSADLNLIHRHNDGYDRPYVFIEAIHPAGKLKLTEQPAAAAPPQPLAPIPMPVGREDDEQQQWRNAA